MKGVVDVLRDKNVMYVEDSQEYYDKMVEIFKGLEGYKFYLTGPIRNIETAVQIFNKNPVDIVIVDHFAGGFLGSQLVERLEKYCDVEFISCSKSDTRNIKDFYKGRVQIFAEKNYPFLRKVLVDKHSQRVREVMSCDEKKHNDQKKFHYKDNVLFLNGKEIFRVPSPDHHISAVGYYCKESGFCGLTSCTMYVTSGCCCFGYVAVIWDGEKGYSVQYIRPVDLGIHDVMLLAMDKSAEKYNLNYESLMVCGYACHGSGVRLIPTKRPEMYTVFSTDEYENISNANWASPTFRIDKTKGRIWLDTRKMSWRTRPGQERDKDLPSVLVNTNNEELVCDSVILGSVDLTDRLYKYGVNIGETIERVIFQDGFRVKRF